MAYIYYSEENSFLEPKMLNQLSNDGKAVGEFPILYYGVAQLYKVFGQSDSIYRLTCWLIGFLGYFALFKLVSEILNDFKWGIIISLLTFTSPILIYYGINFLPDPLSLSFVFISWYFIYKHSKRKKLVYYILGMLFMTLAALLKITSLLSFIAVFMGLIVQHISSKKAITLNWKMITATVLSILTIVSWVIFSKYYNQLNQTTYFFLGIAPAWNLSNEDFWITVHYISDWTKEYFYPTGRHLIYLFATLIITPIFKRKLNKALYYSYLFSVIGFFSFIALFFQKFKDHDYYMTPLLFIIPLTITLFLFKFNFFVNKSMARKSSTQAIFAILLIASSLYAKSRTEKRFSNKSDWVMEELYSLTNAVESYGISNTDLIILPLDPSLNINLYALKMKGWTKYNVEQSTKKIDLAIKKGAKWMVLPKEEVGQHKYLDKYLTQHTLTTDGVSFYKLQFTLQN
ncbi:MAG: 4-amino-4-deoxy-L-arabinose transferase-like glycosyltransferase [Vicingaceae bacterium]|jgi:4-amino-4-deoxy-L-arabinose transferase-like glycosyltransferase